MRILKFNESNKFQEMKSIIDDVNNILVELRDENISIHVEPSNDIKVKMASIQDGHFYINFLKLSEPWSEVKELYTLIFEKIHMLIDYLEVKGFYTEISVKTYDLNQMRSTQSYERAIQIEELESNLVEIPAYRLSYINLKFYHNELNESLPRQQSVDQLKKIMKISAKTDIGNRISDMNKQGANIQYIQNPIDTGIESYEDYEKHNKKFVPSWNLKHLLGPFENGEKKIKIKK
jgi:hypothetical protein